MVFSEFTHLYFVGIGGIGMSALARFFKLYGKKIAGYDKTPTSLTQELITEGIEIHYQDNVTLISQDFLSPKTTLVVWTPAIPKSHTELSYFLDNGFQVKKRAEVLGIISKEFFTIAIAGTHGKTTTSSLLAHLLYESGQPVTAILGGISANFNSNLLLPEPSEQRPVLVVEADEYDRSFWQLAPDWAIITAIEPDHLDIYGTYQSVEESFNVFTQKIKNQQGKIWIQHDFRSLLTTSKYPIVTYGAEKGNLSARNIRTKNHSFIFDLYTDDKLLLSDLCLEVPGRHNVENAVVALAVALSLGCEPELLKKALASYKGVKRRFEYVFKGDRFIYIDDYAHHPTEIRAFLSGVKELYPDKKIAVVFQPHLYSRTRDFSEGFAESLSIADRVYLMDIYPARELPIEGVTSKLIYDSINAPLKTYLHDELQLINIIRNTDADIIATVGAGDIDRFVPKIAKILISREMRDSIMELRNQYQIAQEKIANCAHDIATTLGNLPYNMHTSTDVDKLYRLYDNKMKIKQAVEYCQDSFIVIDSKIEEINTMIRYCNQLISEATEPPKL